MSFENLPTLIGCFLVIVGLAMTIYQMSTSPKEHARSMSAGPHGITMSTTYPGLIITGLGVLLLIAVVARGH
ncbi:MAG: hypothetical protein ACLP4V_01100 [Methylocella sp.]